MAKAQFRATTVRSKMITKIFTAREKPEALSAGFYVYAPGTLKGPERAKVVAQDAQIIAALPWPADHLFKFERVPRQIGNGQIFEWGIFLQERFRRVKYVVRSADARLVSNSRLSWYAEPDSVAYLNNAHTYLVVRLRLLRTEHGPDDLLFA
ncbi:MAG: hypothetical protein NTY66_04260 [Candidatus Vogelbacteria bacterium]|nr:hypothetical protein [Candidatus Vogelbacteria bacterium]